MKILAFLALCLALLLTTACAGEPAPGATADLAATVEAAVSAALPTTTPTPTTDVNATITVAMAATRTASPTETPTPPPMPDLDATVDARLAATIAATSTPAQTPMPTSEPTPDVITTTEPHIAATIVATPTPTQTPTPTATPVPTATPTPVPTATPAPKTLPLIVTPALAVPRQSVIIEGDDFTNGALLESLQIGGINAYDQLKGAKVTTSGKVLLIIEIPVDLTTAGEHAIRVEDTNGRVGEGVITVPEASITLSPPESRRGTTVEVTGMGFPADDLVMISYSDNTSSELRVVTAITTDSTGKFEARFHVPSNASFGTENRVVAQSQGNEFQVAAETVHRLPDPKLSLDTSSVESCERITLTGENLPSFGSVKRLDIGDVSVLPSPKPATSVDGMFSASVLVPQLEPGSYVVSVEVGEILTSASLTVTGSTIHERRVADPQLTLHPATAMAGHFIEIKGEGFLGCAIVNEISLDDRDIGPVPAPETDAQGNFSAVTFVPQLTPGPHLLTVEVARKETEATILTVVPFEIEGFSVESLFEPLMDDLLCVAYLNRDTEQFHVYSPTGNSCTTSMLPSFDSHGRSIASTPLTHLFIGDVISITVRDQVTFRGYTLYEGVNVLVLD